MNTVISTNRPSVIAGVAGRIVDYCLAQPGREQHPVPGQNIAMVHQHLEIREKRLDVWGLRQTRPAHDPEWNLPLVQSQLQRVGKERGTVEHDLAMQVNTGQVLSAYLVRNPLGFGVFAVGQRQNRLFATLGTR